MKLSKEFIAKFREEAKRARWEINSWNGKGIDDLVVDYIERKELKPEDFTGAIVLSIEEACEILDYLGYLHLSGGRDSFLKGLEKCNQNLYERIEQAEVQDEIK